MCPDDLKSLPSTIVNDRPRWSVATGSQSVGLVHRSDDGEKSDDKPDVEAHRARHRARHQKDDGDKSDDQPDVEAHKFRIH